MALVPASSSGPGTSGGTLVPSSSEGQGSGASSALAEAGVISTADALCMGGMLAALAGAPASSAYAQASLAFLWSFSLPQSVTCRLVGWSNGATVSGNVDMGVYNEDGTRVFSCGSTAQAGISAMQTVAVNQVLAAGSYFLALACDNTTATFLRWTTGAVNQLERASGMFQVAASFPLPASLAPAVPAFAYVVACCVGFNTVL